MTDGLRSTEYAAYFSEWRHFKILFATSGCWFLLDIAYVYMCAYFGIFTIDGGIPPRSFYGVNLNQNVVLEQIGFAGKSGSPWNRLFKIGLGNLIVTGLGFLPGKPRA